MVVKNAKQAKSTERYCVWFRLQLNSYHWNLTQDLYILDAEISPHGYEILRKDRNTRAGSRVLLAVTKRLNINNILQLPGQNIAVDLKFRANKLALVLLCYRAPDIQELLKTFRVILERRCNKNYPLVLIMGEFNYRNIHWIDTSDFVNTDHGPEFEFTTLLSDIFLFQMSEFLTRDNITLDLVYCCNPDVINNIFVYCSFTSDIKSIRFDFLRNVKLISLWWSRESFDYKNANFDFLRGLSKAKPAQVPSEIDINTAFSS